VLAQNGCWDDFRLDGAEACLSFYMFRSLQAALIICITGGTHQPALFIFVFVRLSDASKVRISLSTEKVLSLAQQHAIALSQAIVPPPCLSLHTMTH
jgi:hypothetical protein